MKNPFKNKKVESVKIDPNKKTDESCLNVPGERHLSNQNQHDPSYRPPIDKEVVELVTGKGNSFRMSRMSKIELDEIFEIIILNAGIMENSSFVKEMIEAKLNLYCSVEGWNVDKVIEMFTQKQEIIEEKTRQ